MNKLSNILIQSLDILSVLWIFILYTVIVYQCGKRSKDRENEVINHTDTVWMTKPFEMTKPFKLIQVPQFVLLYPPKDKPEVITKIDIKHDTILVHVNDSIKLPINSSFLTSYPGTSRLLQFNLQKDHLNLVLQDTSGRISSKGYSLNLNKYKYLYNNNNLTYKKVSSGLKLTPFTSFQYRPFHNLYDLNFGIFHNTSKFHYEAGINTFYYPMFSKKLGADVYVQVKYSF